MNISLSEPKGFVSMSIRETNLLNQNDKEKPIAKSFKVTHRDSGVGKSGNGRRGSLVKLSVLKTVDSFIGSKSKINQCDEVDINNMDIDEREKTFKTQEEKMKKEKEEAERNKREEPQVPIRKIPADSEDCHINLDVELYEINTTHHWFAVVGFVRLVIDPDSDVSKDLKFSLSKLGTEFVKFSKKENGKYHDVCIEESGPTGLLPLNPKYMFYNSIEEELIYTDLYLDDYVEEVKNEANEIVSKTTSRKAIVNIRFKAKLQQKFDISAFPYDRQYLCIKLNARTQYKLISREENIKLPSNFSFMKSPFVSKLAYSLSSFTHVAAFADLIPYTSEKDEDNKLKFKLGKPLYYTVVDRNPSFYYKSYFVPLTLMFLMMLMILVMNPYGEESFSNRVNAILSLFVALIGMKYVMIQGLSEGEEQTFIDNVMNVSFFFIVVLIVDTIAIHVFQDRTQLIEAEIEGFRVRLPDFGIFFIILGYIIIVHFRHVLITTGFFGCCDSKKIKRPFVSSFQKDSQLVKVIETFIGRESKNRFETKPYRVEKDGKELSYDGVYEVFGPDEETDWAKIAFRNRVWRWFKCVFGCCYCSNDEKTNYTDQVSTQSQSW